MRKQGALLTIVMVVLTMSIFNTSCNKEEDIRFTIPITVTDFEAGPFAGGGVEKVLNTEEILTDIEAALNANGASLNDVSKIQLNNLTLRLTGPAGVNFDDVLYIIADVDVDGKEPQQIGIADSIDAGLTSLTFDSDYADLSGYIKSDGFDFILRAYFNQNFPRASYEVDLTLEVLATVKD